MLVKVTKIIKSTETVEVDLPYYYEHDLLLDHADCVIYGKFEEDKHTAIRDESFPSGTRVEIKTEEMDWHYLSCYLADEYRSSAESYEAARAKALALISNA